MAAALESLSKLIKRAQEGVLVEGQHIQTASMVLEPGTIFCSLRYRSANSRGANNTEFRFRSHDEPYSTKISRARALEILMAEG